jgi:hypothetical protein
MDSELLTVKEVADWLRVSPSAARRDAFFEPFVAFDVLRPRRVRAYVDWDIE